MSRYSGPKHRGAGRTDRARRRAEAETRQAAERARDAARRAAQPPARDLTDEEFLELLRATRAVAVRQALHDLEILGVQTPTDSPGA